jgi:hypothetical protein
VARTGPTGQSDFQSGLLSDALAALSSLGSNPAMDEEISRFRAELKLRAARDMCRRFLIFGSCMQLDDDNYYGLKAAVAEQFQIHPNEIIVVGSAKLGFSIAPTKRYRAFGETSDIDVAIVSPQLFDHVWHEVLEYLDSARSWENRREFSNYFVRGWVRPDIKIAGALYRDWIFLEKYQESCILKCREAEEVSR